MSKFTKNLTSNSFHFSVTNVWTADDRKNGRNVGKPIRAPSPISQTLNNNAVKAYRGTPQNPGGGSPSVLTFFLKFQNFSVKSNTLFERSNFCPKIQFNEFFTQIFFVNQNLYILEVVRLVILFQIVQNLIDFNGCFA